MAIGHIAHGAFHKWFGKKPGSPITSAHGGKKHKPLYAEEKHESRPIHGPRHDKGRKLYK